MVGDSEVRFSHDRLFALTIKDRLKAFWTNFSVRVVFENHLLRV